MDDILREDLDIVAWWGTWPECAVAISRLEREDNLDVDQLREARALLDALVVGWTEVQPTEDIRLSVSLLSQNHPLKAADAFQLAAALRWCKGEPVDRDLVCLDRRLRRAARDEGFRLLPETMEGMA